MELVNLIMDYSNKYLAYLILISLGIYILINAYIGSNYIDFYPINGDFQAFNPFRRLDEGYTIAKDFNIYLGLGLTKFTYYFYSLVKLFDMPGLKASYYTFCVLCPVVFIFNTFWCSRLFSINYFQSGFITILIFVNSFFLPLTESGNSLLGMRAAIPFLVAYYVYVNFNRLFTFHIRTLLGLICGFVIIWSPDYGVPTWLATILVIIILNSTSQKYKKGIQYVTEFALVSLSSFFIIGSIFTDGHFLYYLKYLDSIKQNQLWYFLTGWYLDQKIFELSDIPSLHFIGISLAVMAYITYLIVKNKDLSQFGIKHSNLSGILIILIALLGGTYSPQLYGHISFHYALPLLLFFQIIVIKIIIEFTKHKSNFNASQKLIKTLFIIMTIFLIYQLSLRGYFSWERNYNPKDFTYEPSIQANLHNAYVSTVSLAKLVDENTKDLPKEKKLFSTYTSFLDNYIGAFNASKSDYIIHALGKSERDSYLERFRAADPKYVSIIRSNDISWAKWNQRVNTEFFKEVYKNYEPFAVNWYTIIYGKRSEPLTPIGLQVPYAMERTADNKITIMLPAERLTNELGHVYGLADIEYKVTREKSYVPIIGGRTYTQVHEFNILKEMKHKRNYDLGLKYGLSKHQKEIFFDAENKAKFLVLQFTSFPEASTRLEITKFNPYVYFQPDIELKKIPHKRNYIN